MQNTHLLFVFDLIIYRKMRLCVTIKKKHSLLRLLGGLRAMNGLEIRAATNDYFNNRLICRLFFRLIDESDKKQKTKKSIHFQPFIQKQI